MSMELFWHLYVFGIGAAVGSFLNVVIYRLPEGQSLIRPGSHCTKCDQPIKWYHNIPILSWFHLKGRCADCGGKYSARYMMIEILTALLFTAVYSRFGYNPASLIYMALIASFIAIAFIDIDHLIIPDKITIPGIVIGFACSAFILPPSITDSFLGFAIGGGILLALAMLVPHGMGGGDIKFMAMAGAFLGLKGALITLFFGSFIGSIGGLIGIAIYGKKRETLIPFGPYLVIAATLAILFEREIIELYIKIFV